MSLARAERIDLIRSTVDALEALDFDDAQLILSQFDVSTWSRNEFDRDESERTYFQGRTASIGDDLLTELHGYLTGGVLEASLRDSTYGGPGLFLFFSHMHDYQKYVGDVSDRLRIFGVEAFVAHTHVEVDMEWQAAIEKALDDCHAMVAFLHKDFEKSLWCDQEVGWVLGRQRPLLSLIFDGQVHGFPSKKQGLKVGSQEAVKVADAILEWVAKRPALESRFAASLAQALFDTSDFHDTIAIWGRIGGVQAFSDDQLDLMLQAARHHAVENAFIGFPNGRAVVERFVAARRSAPEDPWASAPAGG